MKKIWNLKDIFKDKGQRTMYKGLCTKDKGQRTMYKGQRTKDNVMNGNNPLKSFKSLT